MEPDKSSPGGSRRTRKWATKTRTGCITCRRRRIKCDEGAPSCKKCISTGRECEGYSNGAVAVAAAAAYTTGAAAAAGLLAVYNQPMPTVAPAGVDASHAERGAFAMLRGECVRRMAGLFSASFWTVDVMRATHVYPAIWHAGLALAAMHRATCITAQTAHARASRQRHEAFALAQFHAAVLAVLRLTRKPVLTDADKEAILLASTLFTGLCCLQENYEQASRHANGGNRLYWQWEYWKRGAAAAADEDGEDGDEDGDATCTGQDYRVDNQGLRRAGCVLTTKSLTAVFTHFEMQFCSRFRTTENPEWRWCDRAHRCSAAPFASAADAYTELQPLLTGYCHMGRYLSVPRDVAELAPIWRTVDAYVRELRAWQLKFDDLLARRRRRRRRPASDDDDDDDEEHHHILSLQLLWMVLETCLGHSEESGEMIWDERTADMERVTAFAETHFAARCRPGAPRVFTFSFAMSICEMLTFVGTNCRDGGIRRRLITLLHGWRERDGMMPARLLALIVHSVMVLEENATTGMQAPHDGCVCVPGSLICNHHRVCLIDTQFLGERSATIVLTTAGMLEMKLPPYETSVSW
ncbi:Zn(2)-C6 fungal-type DNA-binding domain [Cordyceps militaris]|uniref:Zn(2)-C6 fungal-type DNA-binding domain n=1 Tax=Cordyceps militaris TaxID=73501 RepID=A0A2H4SV81_CORMI|nr:Zn(2)-C6 fungal-type DNA-binding domain [Cordyceps militaris]